MRKIAALFGAVALAFYVGAGWVLVSRLHVMTWPEVKSSVQAASVDRFPATDGSLRFRTKLNVSYFVNGQEIFAEALSVNSTESYAEAVRELRRFGPGSSQVVRYNQANPKEAKLDATLSWRYLGFVPALVAVGTVLAAIAWLLRRSRPPAACSECKARIERHHNFCAFCGAATRAA